MIYFSIYDFSQILSLRSYCCSITKLYPTLCEPVVCSMPGLPATINSRSLLRLMSIELVKPSNHLILFCSLSSCPQSFPELGTFSMYCLFTSRGQSNGASASASVLPVYIQDFLRSRPSTPQFESFNSLMLSHLYG